MSYTKEREEFLVTVAQEGLPVSVARQILAKANTLQRIAELSCSLEAADRDRVPCPANPMVRVRGECLCDSTDETAEGTIIHYNVPRIDRQEARIKRQLERLIDGREAYRIVNTWNGGQGGERIVAVVDSENAAFEWILRNTPFSYQEATANQGYRVDKVGFKLNFQGDPRGAVVKLTVPSGKYDDLSREGLCVPSRGLPASFWERNR